MASSRTIFTWEMNSNIKKKKSIDATVFRGGKNIILWSRWLREASHSQISGGKEEQMWKEWTEISRFLKDDLVSQLFSPPDLFIYLWLLPLGPPLLPADFLQSPWQESRSTAAQGLHRPGFSRCGARVLGSWPGCCRRARYRGSAFGCVFWLPYLSRCCSHRLSLPGGAVSWRRVVPSVSTVQFGSLPAGFQREGLWGGIAWEQPGEDAGKSAPGPAGRRLLTGRAGAKFRAAEARGDPRGRNKSRRGAWREAVPLDGSRTPCPCHSDPLPEFLREDHLQHFIECDWLVRSNERGNLKK